MKILKRILLVVVSIVAILLIVAIFTKKEFTVEREITINKPKTEVFDYIKMLKNQTHYSKWVMMDSNVKSTYTGEDGTVGFKAAWDSEMKEVGKGSQEIAKIVEGERMDLNIHFLKPMESDAQAWMGTENASEKQTKVKWGFHSKMSYPMNIMLVFMNMDDMLGKDIAAGLSNLKNVLEK